MVSVVGFLAGLEDLVLVELEVRGGDARRVQQTPCAVKRSG
jgi:hypothetical protein